MLLKVNVKEQVLIYNIAAIYADNTYDIPWQIPCGFNFTIKYNINGGSDQYIAAHVASGYSGDGFTIFAADPGDTVNITGIQNVTKSQCKGASLNVYAQNPPL